MKKIEYLEFTPEKQKMLAQKSIFTFAKIKNPTKEAQEILFSRNAYHFVDFIADGNLNAATKTIIEEHKDKIISIILERLEFAFMYNDEAMDIRDIKISISKMKRLGINWPELDIIKQSIESDK